VSILPKQRNMQVREGVCVQACWERAAGALDGREGIRSRLGRRSTSVGRESVGGGLVGSAQGFEGFVEGRSQGRRRKARTGWIPAEAR
jgi:hypothetical protein